MHIHELSRGSKLALTLLISLAVILPIVALMPRYFQWKEQQSTASALKQSYTASAHDSLSQ